MAPDDPIHRVLTRHHAAPEGVRLTRGHAVFATAPAPGRADDDPNQDSLAVLETSFGGIVLAVADGVGGHEGGDVASTLAVEELARAVRGNATSPLRTTVLDAFEQANRGIMALGTDAATTLSVAEITEDGFRSYHAGDSQALVVGQRGRIKFQSVPHSPVGYMQEAGLLAEDEAMVHEERHLISNCVGSPTMNIQIGPQVALSPRDTVLLASDGVFDNASVDEIVECIRKGRLLVAATRLQTLCTERMRGDHEGPSKPDDLSFILYRPR